MEAERNDVLRDAPAQPRLSPQQLRVWRLQGGPKPGPYIARCVIGWNCELSEATLRAAVRTLLDRYEILRTAIVGSFVATEPTLSVRPDTEALVDAAFVDAGRVPDGAVDEPRQPLQFAPEDGDVLRAQVERRGGRLLLRLTLPALYADRITLRLLAHAMTELCAGGSGSGELVQYSEIAAWEHDLLFEPEAQVGIAFWRGRMRDAPPPHRLPGEAPAPGLPFRPQRHIIATDLQLYRSVETMSRRFGTTPTAVLIVAWQILFARVTDTTDTMIGVLFDGRSEDELKTAVGPLGRYLPLRVQYSSSRSAKDAIRSVGREMHDAGAWQECFVWNALAEPGAADPFFPVLIEAIEKSQHAARDLVSVEILDEYVCADRFHIRIILHSDRLEIGYDASRFETSTVARLAGRLLRIIEEIHLFPDRRCRDVAISEQKERQDLLGCMSSASRPADREPAVHCSFEEVCSRQPDSVAIVSADEMVTYAALNATANRIAHSLQNLGIGPEHVVAVVADRCPGLVIAVLGILKAGAAFLPIDVGAPPQRSVAALVQARPSALIAPRTASLPTELLSGNTAALKLIDLERDEAGLARQSTCNLPSAVTATHAAYVIFTSGSSGDPKGIVVEHGALTNHMKWITNALAINAADRVLQRTPLAFDAAVWELFAPLLAGGTPFFPATAPTSMLIELVTDILRQEVSVVQFVPGLLRLALSNGLQAARGRLRLLCCGGDALPTDTWRAAMEKLGLATVNLYGPAESCIDATFRQQPTPLLPSDMIVPIGRPIAGAAAIVLDDRSDLAAIDSPGELCIAGAGLARCYLGRPEETAAAFIPHPWPPTPGARLYRSGDQARLRPDGQLEYLGRRDTRAKVRGVRVELDEIAVALARHPTIGDCAVLVRDAESGAGELVAFVELTDLRNIDDALDWEWQEHLRTCLPGALIPTKFKVLSALPRNRSGKIDRLALHEIPLKEAYVAPRTALEVEIAAIWCDILGVDQVSVRDNFFALGGHSVLLTRVMFRLREAVGAEVSLRTLFDAPTIESLAHALEQSPDTGDPARVASRQFA